MQLRNIAQSTSKPLANQVSNKNSSRQKKILRSISLDQYIRPPNKQYSRLMSMNQSTRSTSRQLDPSKASTINQINKSLSKKDTPLKPTPFPHATTGSSKKKQITPKTNSWYANSAEPEEMNWQNTSNPFNKNSSHELDVNVAEPNMPTFNRFNGWTTRKSLVKKT